MAPSKRGGDVRLISMGHTHSVEAPSNDDDARVSVFGFVTNGGDTGEMRIKRTHFIFFFFLP